MTAPTIGAQFISQYERPWSGPCLACGRGRPTHYAVIDGRRRLVRCPAHQRQQGVERFQMLARVTGLHPDGLDFVNVALVGPVTDPMPGSDAVDRVQGSGGMTLDWWYEGETRGRHWPAEGTR
jgi:hypothetical protein